MSLFLEEGKNLKELKAHEFSLRLWFENDWLDSTHKLFSSQTIFSSLFTFPPLCRALSISEKRDTAVEGFGHDSQDRRWTLPFLSRLFVWLFGRVFAWAPSQKGTVTCV